MYRLVDKNVNRGSQGTNCISPRSSGSVFTNLVFSQVLYIITTVNNESGPCVYYFCYFYFIYILQFQVIASMY